MCDTFGDDDHGIIFCDDVDVEMMIERAEVVWRLLLCLWWRQTAQGKDPHRTCSLIIMIVLLVKSYPFLIVTIIVNHLASSISPGQGKISREMTVTRLLYKVLFLERHCWFWWQWCSCWRWWQCWWCLRCWRQWYISCSSYTPGPPMTPPPPTSLPVPPSCHMLRSKKN